MDDQALRELSDLLFGRGQYQREGAPEPELLSELVAYLPDDLLDQVSSVAMQQWDTFLRRDMLGALLSRLAQTDQGLALGLVLHVRGPLLAPLLSAVLRQLDEESRHEALDRALLILQRANWSDSSVLEALGPYLSEKQLGVALQSTGNLSTMLRALAPHLPDKLLRRGLEMALAQQAPADRLEALAALLPHLRAILEEERFGEISRQKRTLWRALEAIGELGQPYERVDTLTTLAPYLSPDLADPALKVALAIEGEPYRTDALIALAPTLPEVELSKALKALAQFSDEQNRARALVALAPHLSERQLDRALTLARRLMDETLRAQVLQAAAPFLRELQLERALSMARGLRNKALYLQTLVDLLPHLLPAQRQRALDEAAARLQRVRQASLRAQGIRALAPFLRETKALFPDALQAAQAIRVESYRAQALTALVPYLPVEQLVTLLPSLAAFQSEAALAEILAVIAPRLSAPYLEMISQLVVKMKGPAEQGRALAVLAARAVALGDTEKGMGLLSQIRDQAALSQALAALAPHLTDQLAGQALGLAERIPDPARRAKALTDLAAQWQNPWHDKALDGAFHAVRQVQGEWERSEVLDNLVRTLPDANWRQMLGGISLVSESEPPIYRLRELLGEISPSPDRDVLFRRALRTLQGCYEGGEADAAPIPDQFVDQDVRDLFAVASIRPEDRREMAKPPQERIVSTGFALPAVLDRPLATTQPLVPGSPYYFWLEVGEPVAGSIEVRPTALPTECLPAKARLRVVLFPFPGGLEITPEADVGELQLQNDGAVRVVAQPGGHGPQDIATDDPLLTQRLFFPVRAPTQEGACRLRCSIYYEQALVQSRLIEAQVRNDAQPIQDALRSEVDYTLSHTLSPVSLAPLQGNRLSVMLNDNGDGTHSFRFLGGDAAHSFKGNATLDAHEVQGLINEARGAMRLAAWGNEGEWARQPYRYDSLFDLSRLKNDLIRFAVRGYRFYDQIIDRLGGSFEGGLALTELMRASGQVQIALKRTPRFVLPAAMIYDSRLKTNTPWEQFTLCPEFLDAIQRPDPLEQCKCFQGDCPSRDKPTVVCPSGFWGYRHALGMPLSVGEGDDLSPAITYGSAPVMDVSVSTDPALTMRPEHERRLRKLRTPLEWRYANTYADTFTNLLEEPQPHLVYFYCHGGLAGTTPFLEVGPLGSTAITRDDLRAERVRWAMTRPLVFINGCHTTALEPETAFNFVSAFVEVSAASGVIGTEITIFEPLAAAFAEEMFKHFLASVPVGEAVRRARLALLKASNPLGLVYIPFVMAGLRLLPEGVGNSDGP